MNRQRPGVYIHPSADVSDQASVGAGTSIWQQAQVRDRATIGRECILGKGVFIDLDVNVGDRCKFQNGALVFRGVNIEDGVFIGPGAMLLNDKLPRAINLDGSLKSDRDWTISEGLVMRGASVGGGAVVLPGITIGMFALVGSGAVVTKGVPDRGIVYGNLAELMGFACDCGHPLGRPATTTASIRGSAIRAGAVRKIHQMVSDGRLGPIYYYHSVRVNHGLFQTDVNVIWDLVVHDSPSSTE